MKHGKKDSSVVLPDPEPKPNPPTLRVVVDAATFLNRVVSDAVRHHGSRWECGAANIGGSFTVAWMKVVSFGVLTWTERIVNNVIPAFF